MARGLAIGQPVSTPLGAGTVRELRGSGFVLVDIRGRSVLVPVAAVSPALSASAAAPGAGGRPPGSPVAAPAEPPNAAASEVDLHGLTVDEALARAETALNDALLADRPQLRLIHGRSGGRIKAALHRRLRAMPSIRAFRLDPRNAGVTVVDL
jgi:hypothetical protein